MATQNIGTLVGSSIRPIDDLIPIASAYGNEVKGGHHTYATLAERNAIIEPRREWNMLCTVYNDTTTPSNNGTYILKYNKYSVTITDDQNWVLFDSTMNSSLEWVNSVLSVVDNSSSATTTNGNRYLIIGGSGLFTGHGNEIVTWDSLATSGVGAWIFTTPSNGYTLRVDDQPGVIYKYNGASWVKEYVNQVRYLSASSGDGLSYTATTTGGQDVVSFYTQSVYYINFNTANVGVSTINIDSKGVTSIKKVSGTSLVDLNANDLVVGIEYQLMYNEVNNVFQTTIGGGGSNVIGPAEDGDYTDGLFTDFTTSTPIGTPIDRFNEILKALVPPPAPNLSSWSAVGSFVSGKLSFNGSNVGFSSGTQSTPPVDKNGAFNASGFRLGIMSGSLQPVTGTTYYTDITGVLNSGVTVHTSTPFPAYVANSFGNGITGSIYMNVNGITISSIDLSSTYNAIDTTSSGATSGVSISAATSSKFPSGYEFTSFWNRTGTWRLKKDYSGMLSGYNYVVISHILPSTSYVLSRYEFIYDIATQSISINTPSIINTIQLSGSKYLSGINYYTSGNVRYNYSLDNIYRNTFNSSPTALTFADATGGVVNGVYGVSNTETANPIFSPSSAGIPIPDLGVGDGPTKTLVSFMTFSVNTGVRMVNNTLSLRMGALRTVQGSFTGATATLTNCFIDNYTTPASTITSEPFNDETYRLLNKGSVKFTTFYDLISSVTSNWISTNSLYNGAVYDYDNGLQVINGSLIYPQFNFSAAGAASTNLNFGLSSLNYTNCSSVNSGLPTTSGGASSNYRTYTRYFNLGTLTNYSNIHITMTWTSTSFVNSNVALSGNNVWVEVKLPYNGTTPPVPFGLVSGSVTGWMDATKSFTTGNYTDGSGCLSGSIPSTSGTVWKVSFGTQGTQYANGIVIFRITAPSSWTGWISSISVSGA
jgi:hypothetical protein